MEIDHSAEKRLPRGTGQIGADARVALGSHTLLLSRASIGSDTVDKFRFGRRESVNDSCIIGSRRAG